MRSPCLGRQRRVGSASRLPGLSAPIGPSARPVSRRSALRGRRRCGGGRGGEGRHARARLGLVPSPAEALRLTGLVEDGWAPVEGAVRKVRTVGCREQEAIATGCSVLEQVSADGWHQVRWDGHVPTSGSALRRLHDAAWSTPAQLVAGRKLLREIVCVGGYDAASDAQGCALGVDVAAAQAGESPDRSAPGREQTSNWCRCGIAVTICSSSSSEAGRMMFTRSVDPPPRMRAGFAVAIRPRRRARRSCSGASTRVPWSWAYRRP